MGIELIGITVDGQAIDKQAMNGPSLHNYGILEKLEKPAWLKIRPPTKQFPKVKEIVRQHGLNTVCQSAHCPNISECWDTGTATFMVMGNKCTRGCRFCAVDKSANPEPLDKKEPKRLAEAVSKLGLRYVVVTSVDRDDLPDQGAEHFAECVMEMKKIMPELAVEVLTPDFRGNLDLVDVVIDSKPDVFDHNLETVKRLQHIVRDRRAGYEQSLAVLKRAKDRANTLQNEALQSGKKINRNNINKTYRIYTKSSLMLGIGETKEEVMQAMRDLRANDVDFITFGQYLRPSKKHLPVSEYISPEKFAELEKEALKMGFKYCVAGPFIRTSYKAAEYFEKIILTDSDGGKKKK